MMLLRGPDIVRTTGLLHLSLLAVLGCQGAASDVTSEAGAPALPSASVGAPSTSLPSSCAVFLEQLDCMLSKAGNEPARADLALGAARALFESQPGRSADDTAARCARATAFRREAFEAVGCGEAFVEPRALPPADPVTCPTDQHFFIRNDGWVIGCLPDCATAADCPPGHTCTGRGSAPGGPFDEAFCE